MADADQNNSSQNVKGDLAKAYRNLGKYMGLGLQIAASLAFFMFVGYWVDLKFNSSPIFLLVGFLMGMIGMFALLLNITDQKK